MGVGTKRRAVSDEELRAALADQDNANVVRSVLQMYVGVMNDEDLRTCGMHAVWRCLGYYDPNHRSGQKLTTHLYQAVKWECDRQLGRERRERGRGTVPLSKAGDPPARQPGSDADAVRDRSGQVRELMRLLPAQQRRVVNHYFFERRTYDEIASLLGVSRQLVCRRLDHALARLRELCEEEDGAVYGTTA